MTSAEIPKDSSQSDVSAILNLGNHALKFFPLVLAATYLVGFVIVALYLANYGASPLDLIKVQYLAAGFWFGALAAAYFGLTALVRSVVAELNRAAHSGYRMGSLGVRLISSLVTVVVFLFGNALIVGLSQRIPWRILHGEDTLTAWMSDWLLPIAPVVLALFILDIVVQACLSLKSKEGQTSRVSIFRHYFLIVFTLMALTTFVSSIRQFARHVYPKISFSLGGGQPRKAIFWLGSDPTPADSFLQRDGTSEYTIPYDLLLENGNSLVVVSPLDNQRAIEFERKTVGAVILLGRRPTSR